MCSTAALRLKSRTPSQEPLSRDRLQQFEEHLPACGWKTLLLAEAYYQFARDTPGFADACWRACLGLAESFLQSLPPADDSVSERDEADLLRELARLMLGLEPSSSLAEQVALTSWRLRRVARYETAVITQDMQAACTTLPLQPEKTLVPGEQSLAVRLAEAEEQLQRAGKQLAAWEVPGLLEQLPDLPDEAPVSSEDAWDALQEVWFQVDAAPPFSQTQLPSDPTWLSELGVPAEHVSNAYAWSGWTAGLVREGCTRLATVTHLDRDELVACTLADNQEFVNSCRERVQRWEQTVKDLRQQVQQEQLRQAVRFLLPDEATVNKLMRYEAHLTRQMLQALHTLERLQAARAGVPVMPPAALDVMVDVSGDEVTTPVATGKGTMLSSARVA